MQKSSSAYVSIPEVEQSIDDFHSDSDDDLQTNDSSERLFKTTKISHVPSIHDLRLEVNEKNNQNKPVLDSLIEQNWKYSNNVPPVTPVNTAQFLEIIEDVRNAIEEGILPLRISQGSSGSYFCKNTKGDIVGVFKPKNEEPYGHLNPKWTKWIHKNLFPCCFGRSCLIPNLGYISEAAASYIDRRLQLNVCPRTEVVSLSSPTFYYSLKDRKAYRNGVPLPLKMGSFQLFLTGYKDATTFFKEGYQQVYSDRSYNGSTQSIMSNNDPAHPLNWSEKTQKQFQMGFERLVVLDYMIRNTDRGSDNWMVRFNGEEESDENSRPSTTTQLDNTNNYDTTKTTPTRTNILNSPQSNSNLPINPFVDNTTIGTIDDISIQIGKDDLLQTNNNALFSTSNQSSYLTSTSVRNPTFSTTSVGGKVDTLPARMTPLRMSKRMSKTMSNNSSESLVYPKHVNINVSVIDNGLAFPYKHPDRWRSYPYGWSFLPIANLPFSSSTRDLLLHLLTSQEWWKETLDGLERLFRLDPDFSDSMWKKQRAVMRGQGYNLVEALRRSEVGDYQGGSPAGLLARPSVAVFHEEEDERGEEGNFLNRQKVRLKRVKQRFETFSRQQPCFSWC